MPNWTTEQQQAIYTRGCNLLVSAAAGSGKTAVLVERIIQMVCDPKTGVDIDKLLIVTFTSAAAAEMKERIGLAINEELKKQPHSTHLYRQSTLLNKASIMTLHSFCLEIVRENFYRLNIDPHFRIADDTEGELLRLDVLEELLEQYYSNCDDGDDFTKLVDAYGGQRDDSLIRELVLKLYNFSRSNPWPEHWLQQMQDNFITTNWFDSLLTSISMELAGIKTLLTKAYHLAQAPNGPAAYVNNLREELWLVDDLIGAAKISWPQLQHAFGAVDFKRLPTVKKKDQVDSDLQDKVKELRTKAKDRIKGLEGKYFTRPQQDLLQDLITLHPHMKMLCQLVMEFSQAYQRQKAKRNLVDFNDLEHYCLKLLLAEESTPDNLVPSEISDKMQAKFAEVLVDEYQDINDVQETILQLVTKPDNMFMVGDVKQSIYRFRLAKPELFLSKYQSYSPTEGASRRRLDLARNFRCRSEVVDGVNFIFQQIMTAKLGEMPYDDNARLIYGANYPDADGQLSLAGPVELHLLEKKNNEDQQPDEPEEQQELTAIEKEARVIGQRIKELMAAEQVVYDKNTGGYRPLTWRDIVILMRSPKGAAEPLMEQFRLMGIPVYADLGSGYFAATEVQTMLALLKIIDNPHQDIPLVAVLRSPILALTAEQLSEIRLNDTRSTYYSALQKAAAIDSPLAGILQEFLDNLNRWRTLARQGNLADLIWTLYRETGYFNYVGAMPEGGQRQANLRALHDRARQYEATSFRGLFRFLRFLERLQENKGDMEAAKALGENENVVRVMSIHKSKGLEFPVVFVAGMGKQFNLSDVRQDVILHKELGLGPVFVDAEKRIKYPTVAKLAIENRIKLETLAEEMRILYVALTRARERLIMVGSVNDVTKTVDNWCRVLDYDDIELPDSELAQAKNFLDWVGPAIVRHNDGDVLRKLVNCTDVTNVLTCSSRWQIMVHNAGQDSDEDEQTDEILENIKALQPVPIKSPLADLINSRLSWHYHQQPLTEKRAKVTVTEIKHKFHQLAQQAEGFSPQLGFTKRPVFLQKDKGLSAAEKGSAIHLVMQHIDLSKPINDDAIQQLLAELELREILTAEQRQVIDIKVILDFFDSPLGARIIKVAQRNDNLVKREMPFSLTLPANEIYDDLNDAFASRERVLVQGVIDCMWQEAEGWVLVDYKSDNVSAHQVTEFIDRYQGQVNLYAQAVATILKQPVKERYLYLFSLGQALPI
ncbi:helicase-exonuclease AddAB subunit AddA [Peptococcaceae bacterium 1198_IL3148]